MAENRGKKFEEVIRESFNRVSNTSVIRLPDPVQGYLGYRNISDFIVYHYPFQYFIECKSVHGNLLPFSNITKNQWQGMLEMSKIRGVEAGVICWWVDKDITKYLPIANLQNLRDNNNKSIRFDTMMGMNVYGQKKRVFYNYDMERFFREVENEYHSISW